MFGERAGDADFRQTADIGNEGECACGRILTTPGVPTTTLWMREASRPFSRASRSERLPDLAAGAIQLAARVGRLRGFRDNLPQEIGDRRDDFGSADIDPERIGSVPGDLVIHGVTTNPPGGDADRGTPTGRFKVPAITKDMVCLEDPVVRAKSAREIGALCNSASAGSVG